MTYLTVEQLAELWHTTPDHIRRQAAAGSIPAFKPGRRWLFDEEMIRKYGRGEWRFSSEAQVVPGGSSSHLAERLFAEAAARKNASSPKNSRQRSARDSSAKRN
jgi:excisionase family DNA binding protein